MATSVGVFTLNFVGGTLVITSLSNDENFTVANTCTGMAAVGIVSSAKAIAYGLFWPVTVPVTFAQLAWPHQFVFTNPSPLSNRDYAIFKLGIPGSKMLA